MAPCVNFITGNANKLREVKAILEPEIEVRNQALDLEEVQGTLEEVTEYKVQRAAELVIFDLFIAIGLQGRTLIHGSGSRACYCGRYSALLQCAEWPSRPIHVRCLLILYLL